ncbi:NAD-dependent epimerase/dehydratase family protein [Pseudactinotalea terrae]|uniref:NAD-dependent epimerase/dehydratase family protein n=1 Tax=Pseudactinotalea terrae TaxID=1743262 RepID=UPI001F4FC0B0|nr:NAD-dependent epimerase/dehydratase family protein [Pseudactinotalea terrae]
MRDIVRILVTGGAGFIGHNLARMALAAGHEVRVLDDLSTGFRDNLDGLDVDLREASLLEESAVGDAVRGMDSIIHLAALGSVPRSIQDPMRSHHANATGTLTLLDQARRHSVTHVVSASSSSVYGMNPALPKGEREWVRPMSPYAVTKLATEQYTLAYQQSYGFETLAFRFFNVYGPGQRAGHAYAAVVPTWLDAILRGEPVWINGDGSNSRDFTYVETVCDVLLSAAARRVHCDEPVNLAYGTNTSLLALVEEIRSIAGTEFDVRFRAPRAGDVPHSQAENVTLRNLFPEIVPFQLASGLEATYRWMRGVVAPESARHGGR